MLSKYLKIALKNYGSKRLFRELQYYYWKYNLVTGKLNEEELRILPNLVKPGNCVLDIGAHFGRYTYPLSKIVGKEGHVYSIEPVTTTFQTLKRLVKSLKLKNVDLHNIALSDRSGTMTINIPVNDSGLEILSRSHLNIDENSSNSESGNNQQIDVKTIDGLYSSKKINSVQFIKCDVEGAELLVFKGAETVIKQFRPVILCEIEKRHTKVYGYKPQTLIAFLKNLGYEMFTIEVKQLIKTSTVKNDKNNYIFITNQA